MSFSKAKRFNYKSPDVDSSPADYLLSCGFDRGSSISKSARFQRRKSDDDSVVCSRKSHAYCSRHSNGENNCTKQNKSTDNKNEFKRDDPLRKSIKARRKNNMDEQMQNNTNHQRQNEKFVLYDIEEFIDDDYDVMTSSEELYDLKHIEECELKEICDAIKRIQRRRSLVPSKNRNFNFEETVLKKLNDIDRNVKIIKEDVSCLPQPSLNQFQYSLEPRSEHSKIYRQKINPEIIRNIIIKAVQNLGKNFEYNTKSFQKTIEEHVINMIAELNTTNRKSNNQIKELCNMAAEELVENLNNALQTSLVEYASENEMEHDSVWDKIRNNSITDKILDSLNSSTLQDLISDYLEQTQEVGQELEEDISDITVKCMDTQEMLNVQGVLLHEMKTEIEHLKSSFFQN